MDGWLGEKVVPMSSRKQYSYAILEPDEEGVQKVSFLTTGNKGFMAGREFILICGVWIRMLSSSSSSGMNIPVDNNSSSLSATKVANNSDVLSQILLCLPVKSLLIFKSVSKKWLFLISDPYFAKNHSCRKTSFKIPGLFIQKLRRPSGPPDEPEFEFPFIFLNNDDAITGGGGVPLKTLDFVEVPPRNSEGPIVETSLRIEHSCNGLLCCTRITSQTAKEPRIVIRHIYIYNPTTKRYKALPRSPFRDVVKYYWNGVKSVSLAFDPIK
ncbi:F-box protein At5g07610-like [Papaver somniferum]|uniref:F-box protein At5g07610-like n=1 Tax=Papaver somniferum TaxID=3469 RepID=UPI000E705244|nr:F-box protein At5g07610-like [Papaver somniferum]